MQYLRLFRLHHFESPLGFQNQVSNKLLMSRYSTESNKRDEKKPLGGYVYDEGIEGFKSKWRTPFPEKKGFYRSKFEIFTSKKFKANITKFNPVNFKYLDFMKWWEKNTREKLIHDQQFSEERLFILGSDLAAAHFIVYRGGAVKFVNHNKWIRDNDTKSEYDDELPNTFDPNYIIEAIDFSGTNILYEGLKNIENLKSLKWISFAKCPYFDDWCLDRLSGEFGRSLEYLDLSFTKVTSRGLQSLYRLVSLKTLKVDDCNEDPRFFETCLEIQKKFVGLKTEIVSLGSEIQEPRQIESTDRSSHIQ